MSTEIERMVTPYVRRLDCVLYVRWHDAKRIMGEDVYEDAFIPWMRGQTCIAEGVYSDDLLNFLTYRHHRGDVS